jgi:hypothetical protein
LEKVKASPNQCGETSLRDIFAKSMKTINMENTITGSGDPHVHQSVGEGLKDCQVVISQVMGQKA